MRLQTPGFALGLVVLLALAVSRPASAQVFGQFTSAETVSMNGRLAGAYLGFSSSEVSALGQMRLSFYPNIDFGFQGGLARIDVARDTRTSVKLGGDIKGLVMKASDTAPFSLALGAGIGIETAEDFTILSVGPSIVGSRELTLANGQKFTPYVGVSMLFSRLDRAHENATDVSMPLRFGASYAPSSAIRVVGELQLAVSDAVRDDVKFTLGADFPF